MKIVSFVWEGFTKYRCQKDGAPTLIGIFPSLARRDHVFYCDGSFKVLVIPIALAELLSCKLLSTLAAGINKLYSTDIMDIIIS